MEESKKIKSLWLAIIGLVMLNISVLGWIVFGLRAGLPPNESIPPYEIPKRLGFNESQKMAFENIKNEHFQRVRPIRDHIRMMKEKLWEVVKNDNLTDSLLKAQIAILGNEIQLNEYETLKHLLAIRNICTVSQKQIFDTEILPLFNKKEPPHPNREDKRN
jgi:periplasmic protein CpxP/Spy